MVICIELESFVWSLTINIKTAARRTRNSWQLHGCWYPCVIYWKECWDEGDEPVIRRTEISCGPCSHLCHPEMWSSSFLSLWWNWSGKTVVKSINIDYEKVHEWWKWRVYEEYLENGSVRAVRGMSDRSDRRVWRELVWMAKWMVMKGLWLCWGNVHGKG